MQNIVSQRYLNIILILVIILTGCVGWLIVWDFTFGIMLGSVIGLIILGLIIFRINHFQTRIFQEIILGLYVLSFSLTRTDIPWITLNDVRVQIHIILLPILIISYLIYNNKHKNVEIYNNGKRIIPFTILLMLGFLATIPLFVSHMFAEDKVSSLRSIVEIIIYFVGFYFFARFVDNFNLWKKLLWIYIITSIIVVTVSIFNYFYSPFHYRLGPSIIPVFNQFAFSLVLAILFLMSVLIVKRHILGLLLSFLAYLILLLGFILIYSRGAWLAAFIGMVVYGILSIRSIKPQRIILLGTMLVLVVSTIIILRPPILWERLEVAADANSRRFEDSSLSRLSVYELGLDLVTVSPIIGIGWGQELVDDLTNAHNSYIALWVGSGIFSLLIFILFLIVHGRNLWISRRYLNDYYLAGNVLFSAFIATILFMLFQNTFFDSFFWAFLGLQAAAVNVYSLSSNTN